MKRCSQGHDNADDVRFCGQCGEQLDAVVPVAPVEGEEHAEAEPDDEEATEADSRPKRGRTRALIGLVLVVIGLAVAAFLVLMPDTEEEYLAALEREGLRNQFSTQRAAIVNAENVCKDLDNGGEAEGGPADRIGVTHFCPQYDEDFKVLRTQDVTGTFMLIDPDSFEDITAGQPCSGSGGYGDINSSTRVLLTNARGDVLHRTELGQGEIMGAPSIRSCVFEFVLPVTEGEDQYVLSVGDRGESSFTWEEITTSDAVGLTLGEF